MQLSIVIPLFNEEESIAVLHRELVEELDRFGRNYELIYVDDGSTDDTREILESITEEEDRVVVVRFRRNYGQTAALQAGFDLAQGEIVVTMDGDLQSDPADIPRLVDALQDVDVATGWRRDRQDKAITRRAPSIAANWLIRRVTGVGVHDNGCTLRAYRREVVKHARLYSEMHRFLVPLLSLSGPRIEEIEVHHRARRFGTSKYGLSRIWKVFLDLLTVKMLLRFVAHPAVWFFLLSIPFGVATILALVGSLFLYSMPASSTPFPIVVPAIAVLSAFAGCHLLLLGMFAELVVRVGDFSGSEQVLRRIIKKKTSED